MKLAIMQPYFFPYIGYWQLIHAVDRFVIYDDVNFIKGGWINRNRILINGNPTFFTIPLCHASPNKRICDISMQSSPVWRDKLVRMVETTYRKASHFNVVFSIVENVIRYKTDNLSEYILYQLLAISELLEINTTFVKTSRVYNNNGLSGQDRIIDICRREEATTYVNPQGGQMLYDLAAFREFGVDLRFIVMRPLPYKQRVHKFIPSLSIIDALMENGPAKIKQFLDEYDFAIYNH